MVKKTAAPTINPDTGKPGWLIRADARKENAFMLAIPNMPMKGGNFWDINRPYILLVGPVDPTAFYVVRPGYEAVDADALDALLESDSPRTDTTDTEVQHQVRGEGCPFTAQIIVMLPNESEAASD